MVIKVSFSRQMDARHLDSPLVVTKFFEIDPLTNKSAIITKLNEMGFHFDPTTLSMNTHHQEASTMRSYGILVPRLYSPAPKSRGDVD